MTLPNTDRWKRILICIPVVLLALGLIWSLGYVFWKALKLENNRPVVSDDTIARALKDNSAIAAGAIVDDVGRAISGARVSLSAFTSDGQLVWTTNSQTDDSGRFTFNENDIPIVKDIYAGVLAAEAPNFLAAKKNVSIQRVPQSGNGSASASPPTASQLAGKLEITPSLNRISLTAYNPWLTLIVLLPALFGLLFAILHLTRFSLGMWVTYWYAIGTCILWSAVVAALAGVYVSRGYALIPLFWSDLYVSSGVVAFAFIGSIVYVAFSMPDKDPGFFEADLKARRKILLTVGGRVLVAPYVALTAYGILAGTFPTLRTGASAAFFGFFTGLWIKVVLDMLNDIGTRFLSAENAQKVADRLALTEVPEAQEIPNSSAIGMRPNKAFLDAVAEARKELLQKENVIGVAPGFKLSNVTSNRVDHAIVVYVYEKEALLEGDPKRVPETYRGFPTDVTPLPPADSYKECRGPAFSVSWEKVNADHGKRLEGSVLPRADAIEQLDQVLVLGDSSSFFTINSNGQTEFDVKMAYDTVRPRLGDRFDFVAFLVDRDSGLKYVGDYNVQVFNDVKGIKHYLGDSYSQRPAWNTTRLRACQVHSETDLAQRTLLHELAHSWCAYATFKDAVGAADSTALLIGGSDEQGLMHWGEAFDDGRSCMDYDRAEWVVNPDGTFTKVQIADEDFTYCPLDLYLMGLMPASQVGPIRLLQNLELIDADLQTYRATEKLLTLEQVKASCGTRVPPAAPATFRQAFVIVSSDTNAGKQYAERVNEKRKKHEERFAKATGGRATLVTKLS